MTKQKGKGASPLQVAVLFPSLLAVLTCSPQQHSRWFSDGSHLCCGSFLQCMWQALCLGVLRVLPCRPLAVGLQFVQHPQPLCAGAMASSSLPVTFAWGCSVHSGLSLMGLKMSFSASNCPCMGAEWAMSSPVPAYWMSSFGWS